MRATVGRGLVLLTLMCLSAPAAAQADPAWSCGANPGWVAAGGQRADAPGLGGTPCPTSQAAAAGASGPGSLAISGSLSTDGGSSSQTTDTRQPRASVDAQSVTIRNPDGKLVLTASKLSAQASAACDANRVPTFASAGSAGTVTLNGRSIDSSRDYSETGLGANGAPLFGKITIHFNEIARSDTDISRRAIHLVVTDRSGAIVFEAVAGQVAVGRDGSVCDPPPVCPPGTEPREGRCVDVDVTPLPSPPPPAPPAPPAPPSGGGGGGGGGGTTPQQPHVPSGSPRTTTGCKYADARAGQASSRRLAAATLCLLNAQRKVHHRRKFRSNRELSRAAARHARDMVARRYFAHSEPSGPSMLDRILHSGYLERYGRWSVGENLGWGWGKGATPRAIVAAWMRSPPHKRNILDRRFHDVGVAVVIGSPRNRRAKSITYVIDFGGFRLVH